MPMSGRVARARAAVASSGRRACTKSCSEPSLGSSNWAAHAFVSADAARVVLEASVP